MPAPTALITGGTRGIGLGIATALAHAGFNLALNGQRPPADVEPTLAQLRATGRDILYTPGNIASPEDRRTILAAIQSHFPTLDVLINNAGVAPNTRADILDASEDSFDRLIAINLKGPYFLTQAVANLMIAQQKSAPQPPTAPRPCIINISSISAVLASTNRGDYCISKAGIAMATKLWAARLAEFHIDVFEIQPGIIATDMTAAVKQKYDALLANGLTLDKRWGTPDDVGKAAALLATGQLPYATGQILHVDGGLTLPRL